MSCELDALPLARFVFPFGSRIRGNARVWAFGGKALLAVLRCGGGEGYPVWRGAILRRL